VKYNLWKGRVHCTLAVDEAKDEEGHVTASLTTSELKVCRRNAFPDLRVGDKVMARVVGVRQTKITKYVTLLVMGVATGWVCQSLFFIFFLFAVCQHG